MAVICLSVVCLINGAGPKLWSSAQLKSVAQMQGKEVQGEEKEPRAKREVSTEQKT